MARTIDDDIAAYFGYVRKRCDNLQDLFLSPEWRERTHAERCIVLGTVLEALSSRWAEMNHFAGPTRTKVGNFLCTYGRRDVFGRCSALELLPRARRDQPDLLPTLNALVRFHPVPGVVRRWDDDPLLEDLVANSELQAMAATFKKSSEGSDLHEWLSFSRYGEIVYRRFRNPWVHALLPDPDFVSSDGEPGYLDEEPDYENKLIVVEISDSDETLPDYELQTQQMLTEEQRSTLGNRIFRNQRRIRFRFLFLLKTIRAAIDAFEEDCHSRHYNPIPERWQRRS